MISTKVILTIRGLFVFLLDKEKKKIFDSN